MERRTYQFEVHAEITDIPAIERINTIFQEISGTSLELRATVPLSVLTLTCGDLTPEQLDHVASVFEKHFRAAGYNVTLKRIS